MNEQMAQDMLNAMQAQRDQALNFIVMLQAEIAALKRQLSRQASASGSPDAIASDPSATASNGSAVGL